MWKSLSSDKKEKYYSASRKADEEHKRKYPGYYYSPKEARLRKTLKESIAMNTKKHYDAMQLVKLVMKDSTTTSWSNSNDEKDVSFFFLYLITQGQCCFTKFIYSYLAITQKTNYLT